MAHYKEEQIAHALDVLRVNKGNLLKTSQLLGIQRSTLRKWQNGQMPKHVSEHAITHHVEQDGMSAKLAAKAEDVAWKSLEAAADRPEKIDKAGLKDLLISAQNAITVSQLLRGRPTSRTESAQIVYVRPQALHELADTIEGEFRAVSGTPKAITPSNV